MPKGESKGDRRTAAGGNGDWMTEHKGQTTLDTGKILTTHVIANSRRVQLHGGGEQMRGDKYTTVFSKASSKDKFELSYSEKAMLHTMAAKEVSGKLKQTVWNAPRRDVKLKSMTDSMAKSGMSGSYTATNVRTIDKFNLTRVNEYRVAVPKSEKQAKQYINNVVAKQVGKTYGKQLRTLAEKAGYKKVAMAYNFKTAQNSQQFNQIKSKKEINNKSVSDISKEFHTPGKYSVSLRPLGKPGTAKGVMY